MSPWRASGGAEPTAAVPVLRTAVPTVSVRVLLAAVGVGLALLLLRDAGAVVGIVLALLAAVAPGRGVAWILVLVLAVGQLLRDPGDPALLLAVLGVHAVAALADLAAALPTRGRLEPAALRRPALRFLAVQAPAQVLAVLVLLVAGRGPGLPGVAVLGAALLVVVAMLLLNRTRSAA